MRNLLQDQLLKAGLVNKAKAAQVAREQAQQRKGQGKARKGHAAVPQSSAQVDARQLAAERAEHDRALEAERNARARADEALAQARQIVDSHQLPGEGELAYRFTDGNAIKEVLVSATQRAQLAQGTLVIARHGQRHVLLSRVAADKVMARDRTLIAVDHAQAAPAAVDADDAYYARFNVPDDLIW